MDGKPEPIARRVPMTRRMKELVDPIHLVAYQADEPNDALQALGLRKNYWDGYFAGRAAPLGLAPAEVVHAVFYNFADARSPATSHASGTSRPPRGRSRPGNGAVPRPCGGSWATSPAAP